MLNQLSQPASLKQIQPDHVVINRVSPAEFVLTARQLEQKVKTATDELTILHQLDMCIRTGEQVAITGRSGSGKSTLLGLLAGLDHATSGQVFLCGQPLHEMNEDQRAKVRLHYVGFVFQSFQLLGHLSALDNVMLPLTLSKQVSPRQAKRRSQQLLERVGLGQRMLQTPRVLSGGEQQRVAIARALVTEPQVIFADEPTGNLDEHTAQDIENLLFELNREHGTTLVLVTHDLKLARRCGRQLHLQDGRFQDEAGLVNFGQAEG
ncbi:ABC transporter ATP-binding protein [Alkanindiges sp. WGS2144]|uniref:ABC transporter ATP-binding protein n=1 Tax=Alkanindiges sp. WGS2144 TaxID=3366808 RepID=UPI003750040C